MSSRAKREKRIEQSHSTGTMIGRKNERHSKAERSPTSTRYGLQRG
jgi:hypothetical protein